ncbi:putative polysaccharide lyase [Phytophthora cinnamomi]|uniref:putative polysaccharide lyase n=1 Tax=Phytophthora cinnamomi TaxID=4785 RepID=UPI00355AC321|nr:putative polysaccharide lyase [Phytophthora cinnamomi]
MKYCTARSNVKCGGQKESGWQTAVFMVEPGAMLKNVIIGKEIQMEDVTLRAERLERATRRTWRGSR